MYSSHNSVIDTCVVHECVLLYISVLVTMERAIQQTIDYTRERKAFGKSILDNQYVHFRLAEMESEVEVLRSLVYRATGKIACNYIFCKSMQFQFIRITK